MTPVLCYLAGPPGAGKSAVMAALTAGCGRLPVPAPVPHDTLHRGPDMVGAEAGRRRERFPGTDALTMSIHPAACEWITTVPYPLVLAEGARLATAGFLTAARTAGYSVILVILDATPAALNERRTARGSNQAPAWVKGAATRARRLGDRMMLDVAVHRIDTTTTPPAAVAAQVAGLDPRLGVLAGA